MIKSGYSGKAAIATLVFALFAASSGAMAQGHEKDSNWEKNHPRREQGNHRLDNQGDRIGHAVKEGGMSKTKAAHLRKKDRQIRREGRVMASHNGGHITKAEQKALNHQENAVNRQIRN